MVTNVANDHVILFWFFFLSSQNSIPKEVSYDVSRDLVGNAIFTIIL